MRRLLVMALAGAALLPATASAATMKALIVHLDPAVVPSRSVPAREVAGRLERDGRREQAPLLAALAALQREGHVRHVRSLWIAGAVAVSADADAIAMLRARPDVRSIESDSVLPIHLADATTGEPGIAAAGAPEMWAHGIDGRGVTVATLDTGVDLSNPELASRYRGGSNSWFDPFGQPAPVDVNGHGTQVMGIMVAGGGIGMAPGARFIAARVFNDSNVSTDSAVHMAFQWVLDPDGNPATNDAPNVVNASWGALLTSCDTTFQPDLQALRAAHILPVFAAGNNGPSAATDTSPGNLPEAFAVGALASATTVASFSSVGPSRCGGGQFPALVAAGTGIRSTDRSPTLEAANLAGTSFSAPHVAGALALLLQVAPQLTADQQESLLVQSAHDLGTPGPDSTFGAGSLDVLAAAHMLSPSLDFTPPVLSGATWDGTQIRVQADDSVSAIAGAEWWADTDPGVGAGAAMTALDGSLDSASEALAADTAGLSPGSHTISVRARDAAGNWSGPLLLAVSVPAAPDPVPLVPLQAETLLVAPRFRSHLVRVASDGFERGLGAWPRRKGRVAAIRAAALSGLRGLRATSTAGAQAFVQRRLSHASDSAALGFALDPGTLTAGTAWIEIAALTTTTGTPLAWLEVRAHGHGRVQVRVSARGATGVAHSRPGLVARRRVAIGLSLAAGRAALTAGGHEIASLAHVGDARAGGIVLGPWHGTPAVTAGYIDIDDVTVRAAPEAS